MGFEIFQYNIFCITLNIFYLQNYLLFQYTIRFLFNIITEQDINTTISILVGIYMLYLQQ